MYKAIATGRLTAPRDFLPYTPQQGFGFSYSSVLEKAHEISKPLGRQVATSMLSHWPWIEELGACEAPPYPTW